MPPINVSDEIKDFVNTIKNSTSEEGVRLPFPVGVTRWMNGDNRNKRQGDPTYFGGWAMASDSMEEVTASLGIGIHPTFAKTNLVNNDGKEYDAYISRNIAVAIFAKRKQWGDKGSHVQWVALAAELSQEKKVFTAWAPVMLTAKGYSAKYIEDALSAWDASTAGIRREFANGLPSNFFWAVLGTFGETPIVESVGKNQKSPITPCKIWLPKTWTEEIITRHFVGEDNIRRMADYAKQTDEWRNAWATKEGAAKADAPENFPADVKESHYQPPAPDDNDIPF